MTPSLHPECFLGFRRCTWSNTPVLQSHIRGRGLTSLPQPQGCSLLSLFWHEHRPLPSAPHPDPTTPPAAPGPRTHPMPGGTCRGWLSPVPALPGSLAPQNPPPEPQLCSCGPGEAKPLPQQGWGRAGHHAWCSQGVTRIAPVEVRPVPKTMESPSTRGP